MQTDSSLGSCPARLRRMCFRSLLLALACLLLPVAAHSQVTFNGSSPSVNMGTIPVKSASAPVSLSFTIGASANTQVGSIAVLTTGVANKDFTQAAGSTCKAGGYTASTKCTVDVSFKSLFAGLRLGAVVFYSGTNRSGNVLATVPIYGVGKGPQLAFALGTTPTMLDGKIVSPAGVAVDAAGNVFVSDLASQQVFKITPWGSKTAVGNGFDVPEAVAVDGAGNVYVADSYASAVYKVTPGGMQTMIGSGFSYPNGVAVDGAGNVYVTDPFAGTVFEVPVVGKQSTVGGGYNTPAGVAVDATGNVYVADTYNQVVYKITPKGVQTTVGGTLQSPAAVAVDAAGNVYITDDGARKLYKVTLGGTQSTVVGYLDVPDGVALDGAGNLYIADSYSSKLLEIERANGPSLGFDSTKLHSTSSDSPRRVYVDNIGNATLRFSALIFPKDFPQGWSNGKLCGSDTSVPPADNCTISIDFHPVTALGSKISVRLRENVALTTNSLNERTVDKVYVSGTETAK